MAEPLALLPRNQTSVQVTKKHFRDDSFPLSSAVTAAIIDAIGWPDAPVFLHILDYTEEQDVIVVVDLSDVTWWAYLPWPAAGPVVGEMWGDPQPAAREAAENGLLCFDLEWNEGDPPQGDGEDG